MSISSKLDKLETDITSAYSAISTKGGTIPQNKNTENLANAINSISGGGSIDIVNGIIEQYKAAATTINANTFVEILRTQQLSDTNYSYQFANALLIDSNKVFITYRSSSYLYGVICIINGTEIIKGTGVQLSTVVNSYTYTTAVLCDTNKIFISHNGNNYLYGVVCTIDGTTITVGTDTQLSNLNGSSQFAKSLLLDTNKVFIAYNKSSYLNALICTINGSTITIESDTQLSTQSNSNAYSSLVLLDTNKIFISHRGGNYLYGIVCSVSGTTVTVGTDTQLTTGSGDYSLDYGYYDLAVKINTNKVFVLRKSGKLYGMVCSILGTTITVGTSQMLSNYDYSYQYVDVTFISTNKVFVSHRATGDYCLYGVVCTIVDTNITVGDDTQLSNKKNSCYYSSSILIGTNKLMILYNNGETLHTMLWEVTGTYGRNLNLIQTIKTADSKIDGLLATQATTSAAGDVWVLNS